MRALPGRGLVVAGVLCVACGGGAASTDASGGSAGTGGGGAAGASGAAGAAGTAGAAGAGGTGGVGGSSGSGATGGTAGAPSCSGAMATLPAATTLDVTAAPELVVAGEPGATRGIFDPSVAYPGGAQSGAMSYSAVAATNDIETRIAVSSDKGATWTYAASVNAAQDYNVATTVGYANCPSGSCSGRLVHQVSSLVFDSSDTDASRRYKLFAHSYIVLTGDVLAYDLGYIDLYTAAAPAGPWTSEGKVIGWDSATQLSSDNVATNVSAWSQMHDCVALTEPGAIARPGGLIQMAVGCVYFSGNTPEIRVELLQSVDAGKTFDYVARLVSGEDALCLGYSVPQLNAADLFVAGGKSYISLTPAGLTSGGFDGYRGCLVFPLDLGNKIERDAAGALIVSRLIDAPDNRFIGACSYDEGASALGYAVSAQRIENAPDIFHIYGSGVKGP